MNVNHQIVTYDHLPLGFYEQQQQCNIYEAITQCNDINNFIATAIIHLTEEQKREARHWCTIPSWLDAPDSATGALAVPEQKRQNREKLTVVQPDSQRTEKLGKKLQVESSSVCL